MNIYSVTGFVFLKNEVSWDFPQLFQIVIKQLLIIEDLITKRDKRFIYPHRLLYMNKIIFFVSLYNSINKHIWKCIYYSKHQESKKTGLTIMPLFTCSFECRMFICSASVDLKAIYSHKRLIFKPLCWKSEAYKNMYEKIQSYYL